VGIETTTLGWLLCAMLLVGASLWLAIGRPWSRPPAVPVTAASVPGDGSQPGDGLAPGDAALGVVEGLPARPGSIERP
jgi:hypothetical protein